MSDVYLDVRISDDIEAKLRDEFERQKRRGFYFESFEEFVAEILTKMAERAV